MTDQTPTAKTDLPQANHREPPKLDLAFQGETLCVSLSGDFSKIRAGAGNEHFREGLVQQLAVIGAHGRRIDETATNAALGFVDAMQPRDAAETALLAQMAVTHQAAMMLARRLNHVESLPQQDGAERALNKLLRTYAAQMDALKRYRSKGQQVVRVERVTVEPGAQAVVGHVTHGGRATDES